MIIAHIDGDEVAYYVAYTNDYETDQGRLESKIDITIKQLAELVEADKYVVYLSGPRRNSFRRRILPAYKAHRDKRDPPRWLSHAKEYITTFFDARLHPRLEADDLLGLAITQSDSDTHIAVTQDKDIRSVPGLSFNPKKPELGIVTTTTEEADINLMIQVMAGDTADGYKGIPGIGVKKAAKILNNTAHRALQKTYRAYLSKGLTRKDLRVNYICARILRRNNVK